MKIGVSLDGVLRDLFGKIEDTHQKYFPEEEEENKVKILDYDFDKWLHFPEEEIKQTELEFNPEFNESDSIEVEQNLTITNVKEQVTTEEFLYEKCTLEIFGYAGEEINSAMETLNQLIIENPEHEFIVISREIGLSVPATFFFLSKTKCMCQNIKFVKDYESVWEFVDVMITDHPKIITSKPQNKVCVKINKQFNKLNVQSNIDIKSIKEIDKIFMQNIENIFSEQGVDWSL
jgi:hypothetical protein